jgi:hypothetical protein
MAFVRNSLPAAAACALLGLVGCVSTRSNLTSSAERLEHNANALARDARDADYPAGYVHDAHELADEAREFRHTAEDRSASDTDVKVAFERVSRRYHALRDDVDRSDSRTAQADLKPVTDSYLDVEREMGGYPERHASVN